MQIGLSVLRMGKFLNEGVLRMNDILFGNNDNADNNKPLLKIRLENLPKLKAGQVKLKTKVTIDTNGYMHVEFVCINTGIAKEAVYNFPDIINY